MLHQAYLIAALLAAANPVDLKPVSDKTFSDVVLKPHAGKVVLVSFWASYCVPCLAELPKIVAMRPELQKKGADVVFVNVDPPGHPEGIVKALNAKGVTKLDSLQVSNDDPQPFIDMIDKKWMGEVPFNAIFGKDGKLVKSMSGEQKPEDLEKAILDAAK
jgi:thiol-disulfide isomerase/thioredoxin